MQINSAITILFLIKEKEIIKLYIVDLRINLDNYKMIGLITNAYIFCKSLKCVSGKSKKLEQTEIHGESLRINFFKVRDKFGGF